ncbi:hypothetical protein P8452_32106 [Trifolium repens]|nr:hypothetical protein P8452_32106 [Trifolium repens]
MLDPARHGEQGQHWIFPADGEFWSENLLDVQAVGPARKHRPSLEQERVDARSCSTRRAGTALDIASGWRILVGEPPRRPSGGAYLEAQAQSRTGACRC